MDNKLPLRFKILDYFSGVNSANFKTILLDLYPLYGSEKQFNQKNIVDHLLALKENLLISELGFSVDENNIIVVDYEITDDGRNVLKSYK